MNQTDYLSQLASRLDLTLGEMVSTCQLLGIDAFEYGDLIEEMWEDGHTPEEVKGAIEVLEGGDMLTKIQAQTPLI